MEMMVRGVVKFFGFSPLPYVFPHLHTQLSLS